MIVVIYTLLMLASIAFSIAGNFMATMIMASFGIIVYVYVYIDMLLAPLGKKKKHHNLFG